jgi:YD repeat-containing protein
VDYAVSSDFTLQYDALNQLTNMIDAVGTTKRSYTAVGQLLSEDGPWASDTVTYSYTNRLRSSLSLQQPSASAWTNGYAYDAMKRLTNITSLAGSFGYQYPASGPSPLVARLSLPGGAYITNSYDSMARLLSTRLRTKPKLSHVRLNIQTPSPPRTVVPVNTRTWFREFVSTQHARIVLGHGCDHPNYVTPVYSGNGPRGQRHCPHLTTWRPG